MQDAVINKGQELSSLAVSLLNEFTYVSIVYKYSTP